MKKRFYSSKRPYKNSTERPETKHMKPGSEKSLRHVFKKIGIPEESRFIPDPFQVQAIAAIKKSDCLVTAPTGAGKTWIAEQVAQTVLQKKGKVWYATPLKALTNSIHARFSMLFGKENVGILTGDIKENPDAPIVIGTTEILRNQLYDAMHTGEDLTCDLIILDEAHFLGDEQRGVVWEEIMIYLPVRIPLLLLSATIGNPFQIAQWLESIRGKKCHVIKNNDRPVPLFPLFLHPSGTLFPLMTSPVPGQKQKLHKKVFKFNSTKNKPVMAYGRNLPPFGDILNILDRYHLLPAIFFLKSRAECDQAIKLCDSTLLDKDPKRKAALLDKINELVSGNAHLANHNHRQYLEQTATAAHHSGHLPAWKVVVETLMAEGLLDAMFATSTVAAGVNFPARSVVVLNSDRFNGVEFMPLNPSEFQQMSGRAGRRGMDNIGFCIVLPGKFMDLNYVAKLLSSPSTDIESQITINFSMVLNLLLSHTPDQIKMLLEKSFASHSILSGKKRGKKARKKFGTGLELLWLDFLDHMDFLADEKFVTDNGTLTEDGLWASKLRIDAPLMVAQSIRENLLPQNDPALLASIIGSFVNEKEFSDDPLYNQALPKRLKEAFLDIRQELKPFALKLLKKGFDAPNLFIQPSLMLYLWAHDKPWEELITQSDFAEGDFARLVLRTSENLRQISKLKETFPQIAKTAREATDLILKEPVVTFYS
ncbi:DEAD/DEAH box helicase [Desulfobacula toluolica]|uniref:HelY: DNA/RNA helicase n=1 Tax=Desulfobacula toluolica (strain DSM 7467 / Tol2) TaxID=651182 RepID=K0N9K6_DESTT|nr:HelY: DNA/RNA helicase [Desulfobacula toluolica Tol2]